MNRTLSGLRHAALLLAAAALAACNSGAQGASPGASASPAGADYSAAPASGTTASAGAQAPVPGTRLVVYKSPTCGCCIKWVDHVKAAGFDVEVHDTANVAPVKRANGLPQHLDSCHTALVNGYVIEGHVPAEVIARLLRERPNVAGIAVPGMPMGSPGMEGPTKQPYDVVAFTKDGKVSVYESR
ncbi:MAG TPA: DUF411 domain-containing protein [Longimicrobium sp.]|nr:DUF411 domain-containing protein [Longimicrobium sp.]